jgi:uncharacterized membrane protein YgcG
MTHRPLSLSIIAFATLSLVSGFATAAPRPSDPCNQIRNDFNSRIKALKRQQKADLADCRNNGLSGCSDRQQEQKNHLRALQAERDMHLAGCRQAPLTLGIPLSDTTECYNARQDYVNNYYHQYPGGDNDHYKNPTPGKNGGQNPGTNASGGNHQPKLPRDGSDGSSDHFSGHASTASSSANSSQHDSGSHNASSGGGASYSGSPSSHASSGGGSTSSGGGGSSSSSSSAASHDSAPARPK